MIYDNGCEFAHHFLLADLLDADAYFAHPHHSWARGLNENTNGLIRQYFSERSCFAGLTNCLDRFLPIRFSNWKEAVFSEELGAGGTQSKVD